MERAPEHSHGGATGFRPPPGVTVHTIPQDKSIGSMMLSGELQAALHYIVNDNLIDRSKADLHNHPDIKLLFADRTAEGVRYYNKTGIYPINHGMVVKRERSRRSIPGWSAICSTPSSAPMRRSTASAWSISPITSTPDCLPANTKENVREPLVRHGIKANRVTLETCARYSNEQGLTPRVMRLDEIFEPG